jgi:hypothetical protein
MGSTLGLNQKVVLLGDNCVIAWAGTAVFARTVIGELRAIASKAQLSVSTVNTYLSQLDPTVKVSFGVSRRFSEEITQSIRAGFADF